MAERVDWIAAKLATGANHMLLIQREHTALVESEDYRTINDLNPSEGYLSIKAHAGRPPAPEWSLHVGEALYQFRSCLNHLACWLAETKGQGVKDTTEFPIFCDPKKFRNLDGTLTRGASRDMAGISGEDRTRIEGLQPFNRPDDPLWLLYLLSNYDRHYSLHIIDSAILSGFNDIAPPDFTQYMTQVISNFGTFEGETEVSRYTIRYDGPQIAVKVNAHLTFSIVFGQEGPCAGLNVISTLGAIGMRVTGIMSELTGVPLA